MNLNRFFRKLMIWGGIAALILGSVISAASFLYSLQAGTIISSVFIIFAVIIYLAVYMPAFRKERLMNHGITAAARVTDIQKTIWSEGSETITKPIYKIEMEITPPGDLPYRTSIRDTRLNMFTNALNRKLAIWVKIDPKNPENVIVEKIGERYVESKDIWDDAMNELNL